MVQNIGYVGDDNNCGLAGKKIEYYPCLDNPFIHKRGVILSKKPHLQVMCCSVGIFHPMPLGERSGLLS